MQNSLLNVLTLIFLFSKTLSGYEQEKKIPRTLAITDINPILESVIDRYLLFMAISGIFDIFAIWSKRYGYDHYGCLEKLAQ